MSRALCVRNGKRHSSHLTGPMRDAAVRVEAKEGGRQRGREEVKMCAMEWSRDGGEESGKEGKKDGRGMRGGMRRGMEWTGLREGRWEGIKEGGRMGGSSGVVWDGVGGRELWWTVSQSRPSTPFSKNGCFPCSHQYSFDTFLGTVDSFLETLLIPLLGAEYFLGMSTRTQFGGGRPYMVCTTCGSGKDKSKVVTDIKHEGERLSGVGGWRERGREREGQAKKQFVRGKAAMQKRVKRARMAAGKQDEVCGEVPNVSDKFHTNSL